MKYLFLICCLASIPASMFAQSAKKESKPCECMGNFSVKYPENIPDEKKLSGTVIVEVEIDSACVYANPKVLQSLGPDYDKEALRVVTLIISFQNNCIVKCKNPECKKRKIQFPFTFSNPDDLPQ